MVIFDNETYYNNAVLNYDESGDIVGTREIMDSDSDGIGNLADPDPFAPDSDQDGVNDEFDAFPNDPTETTDTDNDGIGDNSDPAPSNPFVPSTDMPVAVEIYQFNDFFRHQYVKVVDNNIEAAGNDIIANSSTYEAAGYTFNDTETLVGTTGGWNWNAEPLITTATLTLDGAPVEFMYGKENGYGDFDARLTFADQELSLPVSPDSFNWDGNMQTNNTGGPNTHNPTFSQDPVGHAMDRVILQLVTDGSDYLLLMDGAPAATFATATEQWTLGGGGGASSGQEDFENAYAEAESFVQLHQADPAQADAVAAQLNPAWTAVEWAADLDAILSAEVGALIAGGHTPGQDFDNVTWADMDNVVAYLATLNP